MLVNELSQEQLDELKFRFFYEIEQNVNSPYEITNEFIFEQCEGINFVDDDFYCTMEN